MIVKVCGMGDSNIMQQLTAFPIHMLGFIFYPRSPRYVVGKINPDTLVNLPSNLKKTGVFVNAELETILTQANLYHLDAIQLHGNESPELCQSLKTKGFMVIKAFNLTKKNDYSSYAPYCDYFLFDTPSEEHGGTGQKFDWSLLNTYHEAVPFLLSGGIGSNDVEELKHIHHPQLAGIDLNSKFEIEPGIKDVQLLKKFLKEITLKSPSGDLREKDIT